MRKIWLESTYIAVTVLQRHKNAFACGFFLARVLQVSKFVQGFGYGGVANSWPLLLTLALPSIRDFTLTDSGQLSLLHSAGREMSTSQRDQESKLRFR